MQALLFSNYPDETAVLTLILQRTGFTVRVIRSLEDAIDSWPEQPADLIFITVSGDAHQVVKPVRQFRSHTAVPIILLAEGLSDDLQVQMLDDGVDLLVQKPYSVRVLASQIRALLRRSGDMPFFSLPELSTQGVTLNPATRTVQVESQPEKRLTHLEFRLLYTLMIHSGQIIPAETLIEHVWGYQGEGNRELVRGLVQRLRSKVEPQPRNPRYILTEPGIGYFFSRE